MLPDNTASLRVLAKCGFTELRGSNEDGELVMARPLRSPDGAPGWSPPTSTAPWCAATARVSELTRRVLAELDERDVPVVIVTARPLRWMDDLWPMVGRHGFAIVSNGAIWYDVGGRPGA